MKWGHFFGSVYMTVLMKLGLIFLCIVGAPHIYVQYSQEKQRIESQRLKVKIGASSLSRALLSSLLPDRSTSFTAALLTNVHDGKRTLETLRQEGVSLTSVVIPADAAWQYTAAALNTKVAVQLCKQVGDSFMFPSLASVRVLFIDLLPNGHDYPYHTLLLSALRYAAQQEMVVVILDRPTYEPRCVEGVVLHHDLSQMLTFPASLYRGMTMGELARYLNTHVLAHAVRLRIVPFQQGTKSNKNTWRSTACEYCPEPSLRRFYEAVAQVSPFVAGMQPPTARIWFALPEDIAVAPAVWQHVTELLTKHGGVVSPYETFHEALGQYCYGVYVDQAVGGQFHSLAALIEVLGLFKEIGLSYTFSPLFDRYAGTDQVRVCIEERRSHDELVGEINTNLEQFYAKARDAFMYTPFPCLAKV